MKKHAKLKGKIERSHVTFVRHFHSREKAQKHGVWGPHALTQRNLIDLLFMDYQPFAEKARKIYFKILRNIGDNNDFQIHSY